MSNRINPIGQGDKLRILLRYNYKCVYCGSDATDVDHILPYSYKAINDDGNLVAACRDCNLMAGNMIFGSFVDKKAYILSALSTRKWKRRRKMRIAICADCHHSFCPGSPGATNVLCPACAQLADLPAEERLKVIAERDKEEPITLFTTIYQIKKEARPKKNIGRKINLTSSSTAAPHVARSGPFRIPKDKTPRRNKSKQPHRSKRPLRLLNGNMKLSVKGYCEIYSAVGLMEVRQFVGMNRKEMRDRIKLETGKFYTLAKLERLELSGRVPKSIRKVYLDAMSDSVYRETRGLARIQVIVWPSGWLTVRPIQTCTRCQKRFVADEYGRSRCWRCNFYGMRPVRNISYDAPESEYIYRKAKRP